LRRRVRGGAQHTEPARIGHGGDDVAAVAEREERELDTELLTNGRLHVTSITK
jgi:hypothetical protein